MRGLSDEQKRRMKAVDEAFSKAFYIVLRDLRDRNVDRLGRAERLRALKREMLAKALQELSPSQKAAWDAMVVGRSL